MKVNKALFAFLIILVTSGLVWHFHTQPSFGNGPTSVQIDHANDYINYTATSGAQILSPYKLTQNSTAAQVETEQGSYIFNNSTCTLNFYPLGFIGNNGAVIRSDSYKVLAELDGTSTWNPVNTINNAACHTSVTGDGNNITITATKSIIGAGIFSINYTKSPDSHLELSFLATNENSLWTNYHIGLRETIGVPRYISMNNTTYDLSLYNNTILSRTWIDQHRGQLVNMGHNIFYEMGPAWSYANQITIHWIKNQASIDIDYTYNTPILQPNHSVIIDPSFDTSKNAGDSSSVSVIVGSNTNRLLVFVADYGRPTSGISVSSVTGNKSNTTFTHLYTGTATCGSDRHTTEIWYLKNPPTGSLLITATYSGSPTSWMSSAISFFNVDQTTGINNSTTTTNGGCDTSTLTVSITPTQTGSWIVSAGGSENGMSSPSNTAIYTSALDGSGNFGASAQYNSAPTIGSSNSMTWSATASSYPWAAVTFEVLTASGGGGTGITSINSQSGPAVNIVRGAAGNITITNSTNQIAVNLGSNVLVKGGNITSTAIHEFKISAPSGVPICIGTGC